MAHPSGQIPDREAAGDEEPSSAAIKPVAAPETIGGESAGAEMTPTLENTPVQISTGIREKVLKYLREVDWSSVKVSVTARAPFSIITGAAIEAVAGMDAKEIAISRAIALPLTMATSDFYTRFRDWPLNRLEISKNDHVKYITSNMLTYLVFYCSQYAAIRYWVVGATAQETLIATTELFLASFPLGAAYGYWLDFVRTKIFRLKLKDPGKKDLQKDEKQA